MLTTRAMVPALIAWVLQLCVNGEALDYFHARPEDAQDSSRRMDTVEYAAHVSLLMAFGQNQSNYFVNSFPLFNCGKPCNIPIVKYVYKLKGRIITDKDTLVISMWNDDYIIYNLTNGGTRKEDFIIVKKGLLVLYSDRSPERVRVPYSASHAGDVRLFLLNGTIRYLFCNYERLQTQAFMDIFYNESSDELYSFPPVHLRVGTKASNKHEKNWSPLVYQNSSYFVHWVRPHTILGAAASELDEVVIERRADNSTFSYLPLQRLYIGGSSSPIWKWGTPHGGTNSLLVDTGIYGMKYVHIFHSQMVQYGLKVSYYIGAYLFDPMPPFNITHFAPQPLIPTPFYNESFGWAFRSIDYIVFPMSLVEIRDNLYFSTGYNDKGTWIVIFDKLKFMESFVAINGTHGTTL